MKSRNDARRKRAIKDLVGSPFDSLRPSFSLSQGELQSWPLTHDLGLSQPTCRGIAPLVDASLLSGSSSGRSTFSGYGPYRRTLTSIKVLGGALHRAAPLARQTPEAPCSSTSEQTPGGSVSYGTSAILSLAKILNMEVDDDFLTFEQRALFDACTKDMLTSCQNYGRNPTLQRGQQFLVDLRRMQNLVQLHHRVPGELEHSVANIYIVSQCLTSILQNNRNMCYANAP